MTSDARSILVVANPTSGGGRGVRVAEAVAGRLRQCRMDVTIRYTNAAGDAEAIAYEAASRAQGVPDCVVACGGDGTMQEVANALAPLNAGADGRCPVMGLAPAGRCNDFARALGVRGDASAIAEVLLAGSPRAIDLGRIGERYFCTVATVGVDADISNFVDTMRVPLRGTAAYLYGALRVLTWYRGRQLRIEGDFGVIERTVFVASSANTPSYGGGFTIAPDAVPTDGQLDLCVIDQVSRLRMLALLPRVLLGRHRSARGVAFVKARRLRIESGEGLDLWADGERVGRTPVTIEIAPGAVQVVLP